jgi:predicted DNA-binding transcriptional regulator YafY
MARTHRLLDLMQALRRRRTPAPGAELARETGVSIRTLYRDIAALQAMGADIQGEAGVGYVLRPGFLLPPLMFSEEELQALAVGAQWVGWHTDEALAAAARDAIAKIAAVLPGDLRDRLNDDTLHVSRKPTPADTLDLGLLRETMRRERKMAIAYRDEAGTQTERVIWPFALGYFDNARMVAAWCELRNDFRMFRADRVERAQMLAERYPRRRRELARAWLPRRLSTPPAQP